MNVNMFTDSCACTMLHVLRALYKERVDQLREKRHEVWQRDHRTLRGFVAPKQVTAVQRWGHQNGNVTTSRRNCRVGQEVKKLPACKGRASLTVATALLSPNQLGKWLGFRLEMGTVSPAVGGEWVVKITITEAINPVKQHHQVLHVIWTSLESMLS